MRLRKIIFTGVILALILMHADNAVKAEIFVYDKNDQYLGILATPIHFIYYNPDKLPIFVPSLNRVIEMEKDGKVKDYIVELGNRALYYENSNCTGTAYSSESILPQNSFFSFNYPDVYTSKWNETEQKADYFKIGVNAQTTFIPASIYEYKYVCEGIMSCNYKWTCSSNTSETPSVYFPLIKVEVLPDPTNPFAQAIVFPLKFKLSSFDVDGDQKRGLAESVFILQEVSGIRSK